MKNIILCSAFVFVTYKLPQEVKDGKGKTAAFIPTAAENYRSKPWVEADRKALEGLGYNVEMIDIVGKDVDGLYSLLKDTDVIFIGGGNTFRLLHEANKTGFTSVIKDLVANGKWYIGSSAGSVIAAPNIEPIRYVDKPEEVSELHDYTGFGFVDFVVLPHYNDEKYNTLYSRTLQEYQNTFHLETLRDDEVIIVQDNKLEKI